MTEIEYLKRLGKRIRTARRIKDLTQPELADKLSAEIGQHFGDGAKVSRIEKGRQDITSHELQALSVVLEQPITWLTGVDTEDGFNTGAMGVYLNSLLAVEPVAA